MDQVFPFSFGIPRKGFIVLSSLNYIASWVICNHMCCFPLYFFQRYLIPFVWWTPNSRTTFHVWTYCWLVYVNVLNMYVYLTMAQFVGKTDKNTTTTMTIRNRDDTKCTYCIGFLDFSYATTYSHLIDIRVMLTDACCLWNRVFI